VQVLVDTNVWSLALRRHKGNLSDVESRITETLQELIRDDRVRLIGPIRQELLSGIREAVRFDTLKEHLRAFRDEPLGPGDFERAAALHNRCRSRGLSGSAIDFLICAVAIDRGWQLFTSDADFARYAAVLPLELFPV
jgi:predicted nucleic acid-binding protein